MATLLALDGNSLFHRAFHAYGPRDGGSVTLDRKGRKAWGVVGFISLLGSILEKTPHDGLLIGFDDSTRSLRREYYPAYKAGRGVRDEELHIQLERTIELLKALGLNVMVAPGLEADDIVASGAAQAPLVGWNSVIVTSDRDSFALINQDTTVMRLLNGGIANAVMMTPAKLMEMFGVQGEQYLDYAALRGDKSDNLPGVNGFGEKVASKLLQHFGDVETALTQAETDADSVASIIGAKRLETLLSSSGKEDFLLSKEMMKLKKNIDLGATFEAPQKRSSAQLDEIFKRHQIAPNYKLVKVLAQPEKASPVAPQATPEAAPVQEERASLETNVKLEQENSGAVTLPPVFQVSNPRPPRSLLTR